MILVEIKKCIEYGFDPGKDRDNSFLGFGEFLLKTENYEIATIRYFLFKDENRIQDNKYKFSKAVKTFIEVKRFVEFCNELK